MMLQHNMAEGFVDGDSWLVNWDNCGYKGSYDMPQNKKMVDKDGKKMVLTQHGD
jgi:hypothetical protein